MSQNQSSEDKGHQADPSGLDIPIDPGTTDLGDDVYRGVTNPAPTPSTRDVDPASGLAIGIDPGTTDLGDDVYRDESNQGSGLDQVNNPGLEGGLDPGNTDLGDDVYRDAAEG